MRTDAEAALEDAIEAFRAGEPVCIHDFADREGETDLVYPARAVTPTAVSRMRNDAGGLICVAVSHRVAAAFENRLELIRVVVGEDDVLGIERTLRPPVEVLHESGIVRERSDGYVALDATEL